MAILIPLPNGTSTATPTLPRLDARLGAALDYVRGGTVADVGTDHAYLPIVLLKRGLCRFAIASDIHKRPAQIAAHHLAAHGIGTDNAVVLQTDGLNGVEPYHPDDILIFGMGGEMIVHILEDAPWLQAPHVRLILQPMTHAELLRTYLDNAGFCIVDEQLCQTDRIYQVICAEYDGHIRTHSPMERLIGTHNLQRRDEQCVALVNRQMQIATTCRDAKAGAGRDTTAENALLSELNGWLQSGNSLGGNA